MVTTRSGTKRKSVDGNELEEAPPPTSSPKRQRLPVRKKGQAGADTNLDGDSPIQIDTHESRADDEGAGQDGDEGATEEAPTSEPHVSTSFPTVVKFDDDLPLGDSVVTASSIPNDSAKPTEEPVPRAARDEIAASQDSEDSNDEAPEAVPNIQAATAAKHSAIAVQKAAKEEAQRLKRKRQDRDALFKDQAKSRKEAEKEAVKAEAANQERKKKETEAEGVEKGAVEETTESTAPSGPRRTKVEIPDVLTAEYLDSDDEDAYQGDLSSIGEPRRKRRKSSVHHQKHPRDKTVGSTVYRVVGDVDTSLPPKRSKKSQQYRVALLRKGRVAVKRKHGFLVNKR